MKSNINLCLFAKTTRSIHNDYTCTPGPQTVEVMFSSSVISVTEGSNVGIKLIAQGTYGKEFTVKLTFQDETASESV